jgi:hypothetical protein
MSSEQRNILGAWVVQEAEHVQDMGRRVAEVLDRDPGDTHYAGSKLSSALEASVKGLVYAGTRDVDEIVSWVREWAEQANENRLSLARDFAEEGRS